MRDKAQRQNRKNVWIVVIVLAVFAAALIIILCAVDNGQKSESASVGVNYIRAMEAKDTAEIENSIFNASRQRMLEEMRAQMEEDPDQVWKLLSDLNTVLMGDSRVVGFDIFGYMDESRVIAEAGATIHLIPDYYDVLQVMNPNLLVLSYGINDINNWWIWDSMEEYIDELNETMATLTQLLPNTYIYVQSIFPANEVGLETSPSWGEIPTWNAAIKATCEEHGWRYLDIADLLVWEHPDMYEIDGVHLLSSFYPYWGEAILMQYLKDSGLYVSEDT